MLNISRQLQYVYKAKDCMDTNDTNKAIGDLKSLIITAIEQDKPVKMLYARLMSLEKKQRLLFNSGK